MKSYLTRTFETLGIVGHGGTGKTNWCRRCSLPRHDSALGKNCGGSTTTDWDEEEIARKISIQTGLAHAEWPDTPTGPSGSSEKVKINFIDLPVIPPSSPKPKPSLIAADAALIAVDAQSLASTPEKVWITARSTTFPRLRAHLDGPRTLQFRTLHGSLQEVFGRNVVSLQMPSAAKRIPRRR